MPNCVMVSAWTFRRGCSFRIKSCVNLVWPIRSRERMVSSLLVLLASRFLSEEALSGGACFEHFHPTIVAIFL